MGMSNTSVTERKRTQRRKTRREGKQVLARIAQEQIDEVADEREEASAEFLDSIFDADIAGAFDDMLAHERAQILGGFDPHRDEAISSIARFDELLEIYIDDLGPLSLEESRQRTNMRIVITDLEQSQEQGSIYDHVVRQHRFEPLDEEAWWPGLVAQPSHS